MEKEYNIGLVGGFDVENYGDILFPIIANNEIGLRIKKFNLLVFSYRAKTESNWPYNIIALDEFPNYLNQLDVIIIGGGHLIHFDENMAEGYSPPKKYMHHPTSFWLSPALICGSKAIPVIWNAVSSSYNLPDWGKSLIETALQFSDYISVRDENTKNELNDICQDFDIKIIPDSVFGIHQLIKKESRSHKYMKWLEENSIIKPYIIIQSSLQLKHVENEVKELVNIIKQKYTIIEIPISPILGDEPNLLNIETDIIIEILPDPLLVAEIIANSSGVITQSLHLSITAICYNIPVIRANNINKTKYDFLSEFESVFFILGAQKVETIVNIINSAHQNDMEKVFSAISIHWDKIVEIIRSEKQDTYINNKNQVLSKWLFDMPRYFKNTISNYSWGEAIRFDSSSHRIVKFIKGFSQVEGNHVWTDGTESILQIPVNIINCNMNLKLEFSCFIDVRYCPKQICEFYINERKHRTIVINNSDLTSESFILSPEYSDQGIITIKIIMPKAISPASLSISSDTRKLGLAIYRITLNPLETE